MTERRRPAGASRILVAAASTAATLGMVAAMGAHVAPPDVAPGDVALGDPGAGSASLRVVITDPRIDPDEALAAARAGVRDGRTTVTVPVGHAAPARGPVGTARGQTSAPHTVTRSS